MKNLIIQLIAVLSFFVSFAFGANTEIEYKISVTKEQQEVFKKWLIEHKAEHKGTVWHSEIYFESPENKEFTDKTLRLRSAIDTSNGNIKYSVCYKDRFSDHREEDERTLTGETLETVKDFYLLMRKKINMQEYPITKWREKYVLNGLEIAFDKVTNLDSFNFIEIEVIKPNVSIKDGVNMIQDLLKQANLTKFTRYRQGYIHMLANNDKEGSQVTLK